MLRFFANCPKYQVQVKQNKTAYVEYFKFKESHRINTHISEFKMKLGVPQDVSISADELESAYSACA